MITVLLDVPASPFPFGGHRQLPRNIALWQHLARGTLANVRITNRISRGSPVEGRIDEEIPVSERTAL
jgi:hypothetical protein